MAGAELIGHPILHDHSRSWLRREKNYLERERSLGEKDILEQFL